MGTAGKVEKDTGAPGRGGRSAPREVAVVLARILVMAVLVAGLLFVLLMVGLATGGLKPTGDGNGQDSPPSEVDWRTWYVPVGPVGAVAAQYEQGAPVTSRLGDGEPSVDEVSVTWRTGSRTAAEACGDFRAALAAVLAGQQLDAQLAKGPADGTTGCQLSAPGWQVRVQPSPNPPGQGPGVTVEVVQRRP